MPIKSILRTILDFAVFAAGVYAGFGALDRFVPGYAAFLRGADDLGLNEILMLLPGLALAGVFDALVFQSLDWRAGAYRGAGPISIWALTLAVARIGGERWPVAPYLVVPLALTILWGVKGQEKGYF